MWQTPTFWIIFVFFLIAIPIVISVSIFVFGKKRKKRNVEPNEPMIRMVDRTQFTEGYSQGVICEMKLRKNGTYFS